MSGRQKGRDSDIFFQFHELFQGQHFGRARNVQRVGLPRLDAHPAGVVRRARDSVLARPFSLERFHSHPKIELDFPVGGLGLAPSRP